MRFSVFAFASAIGAALATVPQDLSSGFDQSYQMKMSHGKDVGSGYDGQKYDMSQTMYQPSYGLKDYSKVQDKEKFVIVVVDTSDSNNRYLHYVHHDYQVTQSKMSMYSPSSAKMGWWAPGYMGEQGQGKSYTHLMYKQPDNFQVHNMPKLGDKVDMEQFRKDCGFDKAITGVTVIVDIKLSSGNNDYNSYKNYRNSYDKQGNYGSYWNYMPKYNNYNQGYNQQGQYGNQYQKGYNQYQYMGNDKGGYTTISQSSTTNYQPETTSVSYMTYAASSSGKKYYTYQSKTYTNYQAYTSYMAAMGYSNPSVVMPASATSDNAVAGGAPTTSPSSSAAATTSAGNPPAEESAITSAGEPPSPSTASATNPAAATEAGASASASPLVGAASSVQARAWAGLAVVAGFAALL